MKAKAKAKALGVGCGDSFTIWRGADTVGRLEIRQLNGGLDPSAGRLVNSNSSGRVDEC